MSNKSNNKLDKKKDIVSTKEDVVDASLVDIGSQTPTTTSDNTLTALNTKVEAVVRPKSNFKKDGSDKATSRPAPKRDSFHRKNEHAGKRDFGSSHGNDKNGKQPTNVETTLTGEDFGESTPVIKNRAISEYQAPDSKDLNLLGMNSFQSAAEEGFQIAANTAQRRVNNTSYIGDGKLIRDNVRDISKLTFKIKPNITWAAKGDETAVVDFSYNPASRVLELDQPVVKLNIKGKPVAAIQGASSSVVNEPEQGFSVTGYPYSSLSDNMDVRYAYLPQLIDTIQVVSLTGGVIIRKGNQLQSVVDWDGSTHYIIAGATGYMYYKDSDALTTGTPSARYKKVEDYRGIEHILIGKEFTSGNTVLASGGSNLDKTDKSVVDLDGLLTGSTTLTSQDKQGGIVNPDDFFHYPDLQYEVMRVNMEKMYLRHLENLASSGTSPDKDRLAGFTDKQAFYYAIMSGVNFGTFIRILLYAWDKAWTNGPFFGEKLGALGINDVFLRSMPNTGRTARTEFLKYLSQVAKYFPYNKKAFEDFKLTLDSSMLQEGSSVYSENNPVVAQRVVLSALESIGSTPIDSLISSLTSGDRTKYYPRKTASKAATLKQGIQSLSSIDDIQDLGINLFGINNKSLITQVPMWIPHGDLLTYFFKYFGPFLFYSRLPDGVSHTSSGLTGSPTSFLDKLLDPTTDVESIFESVNFITGIKDRSSLTAIFDPNAITGFLINFAFYGPAVTAMIDWVRSALAINQPWYEYMKSLSDNSYFSFDDVEFHFDANSTSYPVVSPTYKQHIISRLRSDLRVGGKIGFSTTGSTIVDDLITNGESYSLVVPHRPMNSVRKEALLVSATQKMYYELPRVGMPVSDNLSNFDFGTKGDIFYDSFTPWAQVNNIDFMRSETDASFGFIKYSGSFVNNGQLKEPWDLYNLFYYPSMAIKPLYPRYRWTIKPGYDYYFKGLDISALVSAISPSALFDTNRKDYSFNYYNPIHDTYEEVYDVDEHKTNQNTISYVGSNPAASTMRLLFGSANRSLVKTSQWVTSIAPGMSNSNIMLSRVGAISIFTANNIKNLGIGNSMKHYLSSENKDLSYNYYTDKLVGALGLPSNPFVEIGSGGSLPSNVAINYINYFKKRLTSTDLDLSIKFGNLTAVIAKMRAGLGDGEAYPSMSGFGNDLLSHPQDQKAMNALGQNNSNNNKGGK